MAIKQEVGGGGGTEMLSPHQTQIGGLHSGGGDPLGFVDSTSFNRLSPPTGNDLAGGGGGNGGGLYLTDEDDLGRVGACMLRTLYITYITAR